MNKEASNQGRNILNTPPHSFNTLIHVILVLLIIAEVIRGIGGTYLLSIYDIGLACFQFVWTTIAVALLVFIMKGKKWALLAWFVFKFLDAVVGSAIDQETTPLYYFAMSAGGCMMMILLLQLRKNGRSAWSYFFKK